MESLYTKPAVGVTHRPVGRYNLPFVEDLYPHYWSTIVSVIFGDSEYTIHPPYL